MAFDNDQWIGLQHVSILIGIDRCSLDFRPAENLFTGVLSSPTITIGSLVNGTGLWLNCCSSNALANVARVKNAE